MKANMIDLTIDSNIAKNATLDEKEVIFKDMIMDLHPEITDINLLFCVCNEPDLSKEKVTYTVTYETEERDYER